VSSEEPDNVILTYREDGKIDRRRLSGVLGAATTFLVLLLIIALSLGAIGAAGVGIGGFVVEFSDVTAPSGTVYPVLGSQSECDSAPQLMATLDGRAVIQDGFRVTKGIPLPGGVAEGFSVNVVSEAGNGTNITAQDLELRLTNLRSDVVRLQNATIFEQNVEGENGSPATAADMYADASDPNSTNFSRVETGFAINASGGFALSNGRAVVYQIAFGNVDISDIGVNGSVAEEGGMTMPGTQDCDSLRTMSNATRRFTDGDVTEAVGYPRNTGTEPEPQAQIGILSSSLRETNRSLEVGDVFTSSLNLTNTGNATGSWTVSMRVLSGEERTVRTENATLEPGNTTRINFTYEVAPPDVPGFATRFTAERAGSDAPETDEGSEAGTGEGANATDEAEPTIEVIDTYPDTALEVGDTFSVDLNVTNVGNATGDWRVYMNVTDDAGENATVASRNVTVEAGDSVGVSFDYEATPSDVPTVDATLGVDGLD
jgi:hypothetical protein